MFRITNTIIGQDAVAPDTFCRTDKEPLFLTDRGVFAITAEELTGDKYSQERSYYIGSAIREAEDRSAASACIYGDFYAMALDGTVYLLDLQQKTYEKNSPYSSFQYECYYFPDIPARVMFTDKDGALCFGTADGKLCRFASSLDSPASYNDDGEAITAYWDTADFDGNLFFQTKSFTGVAARLAAAPVTGVKIYALVRVRRQEQGPVSELRVHRLREVHLQRRSDAAHAVRQGEAEKGGQGAVPPAERRGERTFRPVRLRRAVQGARHQLQEIRR